MIRVGIIAGGGEIPLLVGKNLINEKNLQHIRLIYAGHDGDIWKTWARKYGLSEYIITHKQLKLDELKKIQSLASINLMLTWSNKNEKGILTSKFYDYLFLNFYFQKHYHI